MLPHFIIELKIKVEIQHFFEDITSVKINF